MNIIISNVLMHLTCTAYSMIHEEILLMFYLQQVMCGRGDVIKNYAPKTRTTDYGKAICRINMAAVGMVSQGYCPIASLYFIQTNRALNLWHSISDAIHQQVTLSYCLCRQNTETIYYGVSGCQLLNFFLDICYSDTFHLLKNRFLNNSYFD